MIFVTSKIVAIHQGRCVPVEGVEKKDLIMQEADKRIISDTIPGRDTYLTLVNGILLPTAGIDQSNANDHYILRPNDLATISQQIHAYFCKRFAIKNLGVILTDSTTRLLKRGVVGIAMYSRGILPLLDKRGQKDIFGRDLKVTQINVVDALAAPAVYLMGECDELQPVAIARGVAGLEFTSEDLFPKLQIAPEKDLYRPLLKPFID